MPDPSPTSEERRDAISRSVEEGVQSASVDGLSVNEKSLRERIEADKYLSGNEAAKKNHRGLIITKLVPPGTGGA